MSSIPSSPVILPDSVIQQLSGLPSLPSSRPRTPPNGVDTTERVSEVSSRTFQRDDTYYFETISFLVEDRLFNVPKYHFVKSSDKFMKENDPGGISGEVPLALDNVSIIDFQRFLKVLYPLEFVPSMNKPTKEWVSVLKLSTRWHFDTLRELALQQLTQIVMDPVDRVELAREFNVWKWLESGYKALVGRPEMISLEEAERIGYQTAHTLYRTREERARYSRRELMERIFAQEKQAMDIAEATYKGIEWKPVAVKKIRRK